jgi:ubiquinone/menaquinone biosynthesis C-methylase UbiE
MTLPRPLHGFEAVDQETDAQVLVDCLDMQADDPFHQAVTQQVFSLLGIRPGARILDIGCGTGSDARLLAELVAPDGQVVGIDVSEVMIAQARARTQDMALPVAFECGDGCQLRFPDASFDGCYAIRTFQHVPDPQAMLAEMIRVMRAGGRLAIADPDHQTTVVDVVEHELIRRFLSWRSDTIRNGWIAHHLPTLAKEHGLVDVQVAPMVQVCSDYAAVECVYHYVGGVRLAQADGLFSADEADRLVASLRTAGDVGKFLSATTFFVTSGTRP